VVKNIGEINTVYSRDGRELKKLEIQLIDDSEEARLQCSKTKIKPSISIHFLDYSYVME